MKQIAILIIATLLFSNTVYGDEGEAYRSKMGTLVSGISDIGYKDARLAFSLWLKEMASSDNLKIDVDYYDDEKRIVKEYREHKFDFLTINPYFYLRNHKSIDLNTYQYWIPQKTDKNSFETMVVLAKKKSNIKTLEDLKGKRVITSADNYLGRLYLKTEILKKFHKDPLEFFSEMPEIAKDSTAILKTFFGKADACVVPEYVLDLVSELNPIVGRDLVPVVKSPEFFIPLMLLFHKKIPEKTLSAFQRNRKKLEGSVRGQNIYDLFKIKKILLVPKEQFNSIKDYYNEYLLLSKRYGKKR